MLSVLVVKNRLIRVRTHGPGRRVEPLGMGIVIMPWVATVDHRQNVAFIQHLSRLVVVKTAVGDKTRTSLRALGSHKLRHQLTKVPVSDL